MRKNALTKEQVRTLNPNQVHETIGHYMLADGFPIVVDMKKSQGMYIYDSIQGKHYLDFFSYFASWALGHNHPKMDDNEFVEKISFVAKQKPSNSDIYTIEMAQFVATFERVAMPDEFEHLFFISGGALGVENAIKASCDWKIRKNIAAGKEENGYKVIHFRDAFHGRTGYTLSLTNTFVKNKTKFFARFDWPRIDSPAVKFPLEGDNLKSTEENEKHSIAQIESILKSDSDDVSSIIIEPIQAEGGDNHFRPEFMRELRRIADEYDIMLIFDEVQTGLGLTGKMWAYEHLGIVPDMLCFGKKTQVCGFMATDRINDVEDNVFHVSSRLNSTWGGNLIDMVRAQRILEIIEEDNLVENSARIGNILLNKLHELQEKFPKIVSNSRGLGMMCAFDCPDTETRAKILSAAFDRGLIIIPCGSKSIRFRPALICTKEDIERMGAILYDAIVTATA